MAEQVMLKNLTTTHVGGAAAEFTAAGTTEELIEAVTRADAAGQPLLLIGGGSNLVISDDGFAGLAVQINTRGLHIEDRPDGKARLVVAAGEDWDAVVEYSLMHGLRGLEALSGIPGRAGATPVQNVGAYGTDVSQHLESIRAWDRSLGSVVELDNEQLEFSYRHSLIKETSTAGTPRFVVLEVRFVLERSEQSAPVRYAELARQLGVEPGERAEAVLVRQKVLELRRSKGMVYDPADADSHSTGSFFTNPIVEAGVLQRLPEGAPSYPVDEEGMVKLSAAWLISQAGFDKGFALAEGRASLSTKHTLAMTNRGGASAQDILALARAVRAGVQEKFGITLVNEPLLINLEL